MQEIWVTIIEDLGNTEYIFEYDGRFYDLEFETVPWFLDEPQPLKLGDKFLLTTFDLKVSSVIPPEDIDWRYYNKIFSNLVEWTGDETSFPAERYINKLKLMGFTPIHYGKIVRKRQGLYDLFITFFVTNNPKPYHLWLEDSTGQWVVRDVGLKIKGHGSDELDKLARLD